MIPYGRQDVTPEDVEAVVATLRSEYLTQGPMVPAFERAVADRVGARCAIAVNSATSALHIGCLALGLGPGDRLWTVPNTFVASANCARYCGADVDFVDIDPSTWNLSVGALREKLFYARKSNVLPKIVVPVHFSGQPTDQEEIFELSLEYGFQVLEDASHAIGASRNGVPIGNCRWSAITVFSFHPVKIITTGEGGMALTGNPEIAQRLQLLRSHGVTRDPSRMSRSAPPAWYYEQQCLGFNYRMTDLHAALGLSQLRRLTEYVNRRNTKAQFYDAAFSCDERIQCPTVRPENRSAYHLYVIRLALDRTKSSHGEVFDSLRQAGIGVNLHYFPIHLQPYYQALGFRRGLCPVAEAYAESAITLPLYPGISEDEQMQVVDTLLGAL